jgi:hypothetical protein
MTNSPAVVRFYNQRGTAEQWIEEGKQALKMTPLSCRRFRPDEVRLWLSLMACNLGNLWRQLVRPAGCLPAILGGTESIEEELHEIESN